MDKPNKEMKEEIETSQEQSAVVQDSKMSLEAIAKRKENYKALVDFFKKDMEIKTDLMNLAPKPIDEYNEDSRMDYLDRLFSGLKDMEFKFKAIVRSFNMEEQLEDSFNTYFDRAKKELSELGYGSKNESLQKIYQKIFADMKPELLEKAKQTFLRIHNVWRARGDI